MPEADYRPVAGRNKRAFSGWLPLMIAMALILVLSGCGTGTSGEGSGQDETNGNERSAKQVEGQSTPEAVETTGQGSGDDSGLGNPALGDSGAPVVMVEYADYQ